MQTNNTVAASFAMRREARAANFRTDGRTAMSYSTTIARHAHALDGRVYVLLTNDSYSVTTARHRSAIRTAVPDADQFVVENVGARAVCEHEKNIKFMLERAEHMADKATRARSNKSAYLSGSEHWKKAAARYRAAFIGAPAAAPAAAAADPDDPINLLTGQLANTAPKTEEEARERAAQQWTMHERSRFADGGVLYEVLHTGTGRSAYTWEEDNARTVCRALNAGLSYWARRIETGGNRGWWMAEASDPDKRTGRWLHSPSSHGYEACLREVRELNAAVTA